MTKLIGSTKRTDWDIRWPHEQPRDWEKGRIAVEGDGFQQESIRIARKISGVILGALAAWAVLWLVMRAGQ